MTLTLTGSGETSSIAQISLDSRGEIMDLTNPIAEGTLTMTRVTIGEDGTTLNYEGNIGPFRPFITQHLRVTDGSGESRVFDGDARVFVEDDAMVSVKVTGTWRRSQGNLTLFSLDNFDDGMHNFTIFEIDILKKSADLTVYSLN